MNKFYVFTSPFYSSLWDGNRSTKLNRTDLNLKPKLSVTFKIFVVLTLGSDGETTGTASTDSWHKKSSIAFNSTKA